MSVSVSPVDDEARQRRRARRTALLLGLVALAFYLGFIAIGVLRS